MKLADHVQIIKELIEKSFDKEFSKLGIMSSSKKDVSTIPSNLLNKREKFENILDSHEKELGSYEKGRERAIDELTFTLFNRIAAIKVMEAKELFPPIITKSAEHGNRSFGHKVWLEENPNMMSADFEGIRDYIIYAFDNLGETLPLYNKKYPYALLPDVVSLNDIIEKFNSVEKDSDIDDNVWASDDILGWLYESYNNDKKQQLKESGEKTEYNNVSIQSQVYTPRWVVEFLVNNSLGKLYMEMYPDSKIGQKFKIANLDDGVKKEPKPITEFKTIDPACGSGNFLLYTFDFLYELYQDQIDNYGLDIDEKDIPKSIIENNIYGIDLDDRAIQLAQLGLFIKAKTKRRTVKNLNFNVVSSSFFLPNYEKVSNIFNSQDFVYADQQEIIQNLWDDLKYAYKFGSLIRINEHFDNKIKSIKEKYNNTVQRNLFDAHSIEQHEQFVYDLFNNLEKAVSKYAESSSNTFLCQKTSDAIKFLKILTTKFDIATANPPYTASASYGNDLKEFTKKNYKKPDDFSANLYSCFIKRCFELLHKNGKMSLVHPPTFMYIKDFLEVRDFILNNLTINLFVEWGYLGMFNPAARVDSAMYIFDKSKPKINSVFIKLNDMYEGHRYVAFCEIYNSLLNNKTNNRLFIINQKKLSDITFSPFIYWISDEFREKISNKLIDEVLNIKQGLATGDNNRFLRYHWEVNKNSINNSEEQLTKFYRYSKGGPFQKWYGNLWLVVNWENNGKEIKNSVIERYPYLNGNYSFVVKNEDFYFKEGITYTASGSKGASFRYMPSGGIFDVGGSCIFPKIYKNVYFALAYLNSILASYILNKCLNPTANKQVGDIKRLPFVIPNSDIEKFVSDLALMNIKLTKIIKSYSIYEIDFVKNPLYLTDEKDLTNRVKKYLNYENFINSIILINESIIDNKIFEIYDLTDFDKNMVLETMGDNVVNIPCLKQAKEAFLTSFKNDFDNNEIVNYVEKLPEHSLDNINLSLIQKNFECLYQDTNDFESFCIKNKINPIDCWYLFSNNTVIPKNRIHDIAMEFIVNLVNTILKDDEDGIIPLTKNVGEEYLYGRIQNKMYKIGFSDAQISSFDSLLGKNLKQYIDENFFADLTNYLNLFQNLPKTPFIWHITSGKEKAFECFVSIYKWSRDNLMRLRSVYVEHRERTLINRESDLINNNSAQAQAEKAQIKLQLEELKEFKNKIDDLLASGYDPKLDDGVGKNIAPLQKRKMLSYEVLNAGQLKKYLNADW